ncbi:MAG: hypothetical protein ACYCPS_05355 [Candidatus Saccharimonadales bacterium]
MAALSTMTYRQLSDRGDFVLTGEPSEFYTGTAAVAQAVLTNLRTLQGEWWEDTSLGLPLIQNILGTSGAAANIAAVDNLVQQAILSVALSGLQLVQSILSFSSGFDHATRTYTFSCNLNTIYGAAGLQNVTLGP